MPKLVISNNDFLWGERDEKEVAFYTKECHDRLKLIHFPEELVCCADLRCGHPGHKRILDNMYSDIVSALGCAAMAGRGGQKRRVGGPRVVGWNKHVSEVHRVARTKFLEWVLGGRPKCGYLFDEMSESRKIFKTKLKWCQNHQDQIKMDALAEKHSKSDFRGFWKNTNKTNIRPSLPVSVDGLSDPKSIADIFKDYFAVQSLLGSAAGEPDAESPADEIKILFYAKEVRKIIKKITGGKSPGHDGLSIEHLLYAGPHISRVLAMFLSLCVSHSYLPPDLMKTVVIPVVKNKTGDLSDKSNYRPISLATIVAKVFDGLLSAQLDKYVSLHDNQFGFRPRLSTESAILCLKHTVRYYTDRKTPVYGCFLDLSKAFDLVAYDVLWTKLEKLNMPRQFINIFRYWYTHQLNSVRWAGAMSEPYRLECGVRQGGLSSPTLFNLYINDLIVALSKERVGCHVDGVCLNNISYADDMVLLSASVCGLRKLTQLCEDYVSTHGLKYNVSKSQCMVFGAGIKRPKVVPPVQLNNLPLQWVDKFKYLGHIVTSDLKDHADIERERRSLSKRANMIARRFVRCTREVKVTLFRAYCTSLYTCSLWANYTQKCYGALRVQYNNAFRAVLGLPRFCSASGMFAEARTDCFHATMRKRCASLVRRVRASPNTVLNMIAHRTDSHFIRHCSGRHVTSPRQARMF